MTTFTVDTLSDDPDDGLTLREALALADDGRVNAGADRIEFVDRHGRNTITLAGSELTVALGRHHRRRHGRHHRRQPAQPGAADRGGTFDDIHDVTLTSLTSPAARRPPMTQRGGGIRPPEMLDA